MTEGQKRSADWQSAVSQAGSLLRAHTRFADYQSAIQPTASRRYGGGSRVAVRPK